MVWVLVFVVLVVCGFDVDGEVWVEIDECVESYEFEV